MLYGALLNDFILELADQGLFRPLWSRDVLLELSKNLARSGESPVLIEKRVSTVKRYLAADWPRSVFDVSSECPSAA